MILQTDVMNFISKELSVNPAYVSIIESSENKFWVKIPVGLTKKNLKTISEKFDIEMIVPTKIKGIEGLDLQLQYLERKI